MRMRVGSDHIFKTGIAEMFIKIEYPIKALLTHGKSNEITEFNNFFFTKKFVQPVPEVVICF
jgi:hypothetical protein